MVNIYLTIRDTNPDTIYKTNKKIPDTYTDFKTLFLSTYII